MLVAEFYKDIVQQLAAGLLVTDKSGKIIYINPSYTSISGFGWGEIEGKRVKDLIEGKPESNKQWEGEVYVKRRNGEQKLRWLYVNPITDKNGEEVYYAYIIRDFHVCGFDPLTKLPNRLLLGQRMNLSLEKARENDAVFAVLFLDLDRFKFVNDTLGHAAGDQLLQEAAQRIQQAIGETNTLVRMGGDEFVCVLEQLKDESEAELIARKVLGAFSSPFLLNNMDIFVSVSIGLSLYPYDGDESDTLVTNADSAMYRAKRNGRNRFEKARVDVSAGAFERLLLENSLRKAIENEELTLHFQPQVHLKTDTVTAVEALLRWNHPEIGVIPPGDFIPIAEETGLIVEIGDWVLRTACEKVKQWHQEGFPPLRVAVNLSAVQFLQKDLVHKIDTILEETSFDPCYLELEITENMVMRDVHSAIMTLKQLKERGIHISIDDFGTGYSTLSYLKEFPVDTLKIDRSFIKDIDTNPSSVALTKAITTLAHDLQLNVIAEGVENYKQLSLVKKQSCDAVQGFYYSKPVSEEEITHFLKGKQRQIRA